MIEREIKITEMPPKDVLEDYLMSNYGGVGVCFNPEQGVFKRTMPREDWLEYRRKTKEQEENYARKVRAEIEGIIFDE